MIAPPTGRRRVRVRVGADAGEAGSWEEPVVAVIKTIDLVGVSTESWSDAAERALEEASRTIRGIHGMDLLESSCTVADGKIVEYMTHVQIKFRIER